MLPEGFDILGFRQDLIAWWTSHQRSFPWRETRDPYRVLIAEVLLHRTRAEQAAGLYSRFLREYPDVRGLAAAPVEHLRTLLDAAGLHWRIPLLSAMAGQIVRRFGGQIPRDSDDLQSLPGVGPYISGAVRCFAFGEPDPLLDTNTVRIAARLFGLTVTDGSRRSVTFRQILSALVDPMRPREFNFAMLDHGAIICRSQRPLCTRCPVLQHCQFGQTAIKMVPHATPQVGSGPTF